jgi:hypothetical protein
MRFHLIPFRSSGFIPALCLPPAVLDCKCGDGRGEWRVFGGFVTLHVAGVAVRLPVLVFALVALLTGATTVPARADCVQSGSTVTCSGASPGGFNAGAQNALTVNVQPGAAVGTGLVLNNNNLVSNLGGVTVGDNATAINAGGCNTITSAGSITAGTSGTGISSTARAFAGTGGLRLVW